jgi:phospholipase/carboxylesterase
MSRTLSVTLLFLCFTMTLTAQTSSASLHYLVRPPAVPADKAPLIVLLHGVGSNEKDLFSFANRLPPQYLVVSARGPVVVGTDSFGWYRVDFSTGAPVIDARQAEESRQQIIAFIDYLAHRYTIDTKRVYLVGFSQGAIMSYSVALTRPDKVAGIAAMSGRLLEEVKTQVAAEESLKGLRLYIAHGVADRVLPVTFARDAAAFFKTLGVVPAYHEYPEGHTISLPMLEDLLGWLR